MTPLAYRDFIKIDRAEIGYRKRAIGRNARSYTHLMSLGDLMESGADTIARAPFDPVHRTWQDLRFFARSAAEIGRKDPNHDAIEAQVGDLHDEAAEEGEAFDARSAEQLLRFCHHLAADREPAIFRLHNGNLRAVWQNGAKDQIGVQFLPHGDLQFVILRDRNGRTLKTLGVENAPTVREIVAALRLTRLWFHG